MPETPPLDPAALDALYNNRALVPDHPAILAAWARDSATAREQLQPRLDLRYGPGPLETLDVFAPTRPQAPVVVFIHGGYWRSLDKADHSFVAPPLVAAGACVVVINYALCPLVTIPHIVDQVRRALQWVSQHIAAHGGDPARIRVIGHSAGGHLAAMALTANPSGLHSPPGGLQTALSISGLFDLEPLRHTPFLQDSLRLDAAQVQAASPVHHQPVQGVLQAVVGGDESAEFIRQNGLLRPLWGEARVPVVEALPGTNHFSVLSTLAQPGSRLRQLATALCV